MTKFLVPFVIILGILLALRFGGVFDAWPIPPEPAPSPAEIHTLGMTVTPSAGGSVTPSGGQYTSGTELALTATPANGYTFDHWSGGASGSSPVTTVTMGSDRNVTAHFKEISIPLQGGNHPPVISSLAADSSQVAPSDSCQIQCDASDEDDDSLTYTWSATAGDLSGSGSTVTWQAPQQYEACDVTVIVEDGEGGTAQARLTLSVVSNQLPSSYYTEYYIDVESDPSHAAEFTYSGWYQEGYTLRVSAPAEVDIEDEAGARYRFSNWRLPTGETILEEDLSFTVTESGSCVANYDTYYLLTLVSPYGEQEASAWYKAGSQAEWDLASHEIHMASGEKLKAVNYRGTVLMDGPKTITIEWVPDY